jgi:hypothetical protein
MPIDSALASAGEVGAGAGESAYGIAGCGAATLAADKGGGVGAAAGAGMTGGDGGDTTTGVIVIGGVGGVTKDAAGTDATGGGSNSGGGAASPEKSGAVAEDWLSPFRKLASRFEVTGVDCAKTGRDNPHRISDVRKRLVWETLIRYGQFRLLRRRHDMGIRQPQSPAGNH